MKTLNDQVFEALRELETGKVGPTIIAALRDAANHGQFREDALLRDVNQLRQLSEISHDAAEYRDHVLNDLASGELEDGYTYTHERHIVESFMLAGNGPSAWAYFVLDADGMEIDHAYVLYSDSGGMDVAIIPNFQAGPLLTLLRRDALYQQIGD